jgi:hypothetical protein
MRAKHDRRRWVRIVVPSFAIVVILSCEGSSGLIDPVGQGEATNCQLAPIAPPLTATPPCPIVAVGCPRPRPAGAKTLLAISSCSFGHDATECSPVLNPVCPTSNVVFAASLVNPNADAPADPCVVDLHVQATGNDMGGADINWDAQESRRSGSGCEPLGPRLSGHAMVTGPCCQTTTDIYFLNLRFTYRLVVRSDWQGS